MVLTDREIQASIRQHQILITPAPHPTAFSSTSLDLNLAKHIRVWKGPGVKGMEQVVCPSAEGYKFNDFVKDQSDLIELGSAGYILESRAFFLGWTDESVEIPSYARLAARVEGKSSLARLGIGIHVTAPTIHAGFKGSIQLEICNHGPHRVRLTPGMPVCQLIFEQTLGTPDKGYSGQFVGQQPKVV